MRPNKIRDSNMLDYFIQGETMESLGSMFGITKGQAQRCVHKAAHERGLTVIERVNVKHNQQEAIEVKVYGKNASESTIRLA